MAVTVHVQFNSSAPADFLIEMETWLQPYIDAGNTFNEFPAPSTGFDFRREWDTVENANAFITKVTSYDIVNFAVIE